MKLLDVIINRREEQTEWEKRDSTNEAANHKPNILPSVYTRTRPKESIFPLSRLSTDFWFACHSPQACSCLSMLNEILSTAKKSCSGLSHTDLYLSWKYIPTVTHLPQTCARLLIFTDNNYLHHCIIGRPVRGIKSIIWKNICHLVRVASTKRVLWYTDTSVS